MQRGRNSSASQQCVEYIICLHKNVSIITLKNIGISSAGVPSDLILNEGECMQCMTGAKIPSGSDAIVMVEHTTGFSDDPNVTEEHPLVPLTLYNKFKGLCEPMSGPC